MAPLNPRPPAVRELESVAAAAELTAMAVVVTGLDRLGLKAVRLVKAPTMTRVMVAQDMAAAAKAALTVLPVVVPAGHS